MLFGDDKIAKLRQVEIQVLGARIVKFVDKVGYNTWLLSRLQVGHQHVNVEVLALEQSEQTAIV